MPPVRTFRQNLNHVRFEYTYLDDDGEIINLTDGVTVVLLTRHQDAATESSVAATFDSPRSAGTVYKVFDGITSNGRWYWQFLVTLTGSEPLYSPVFTYDVDGNLDD